MNTTALLGALAAGLCVAGLVITFAGAAGIGVLPAPAPSKARSRRLADRGVQARLGAGLAIGLGMLLAVGWPVAAIVAGAATYFLPGMLSGKAAKERVNRLLGIEAWIRQLSDGLSTNSGLEETLMASAEHPPPAIAAEVRNLAAHLRLGIPLQQALATFADDVDQELGDMAVGALTFAAEARGPGLRTVLTELAGSVAATVATEQQVHAERATHRVTARAIIVALVVFTIFAFLNQDYVQPFGTPMGQVVLGFVGVLWAGAVRWIYRLTNPPAGYRFLNDTGGRR